MLKVMSLLKRRIELSFPDFERWARRDHPKLAMALPGLRAYRMNTLVADNPDLPCDAVSEMWFDDDAARVAAFATEQGKAAAADATEHCSNRTHLLLNETIVL